MAQSLQLALRDAVQALLLQAPALADGNVLANRALPLATGGVPSQITVRFVRSTPVDDDPAAMLISSTSIRDWLTELEVQIVARKVEAAEAADVADAVWVEVHNRVMANQALGGLAIGLFPGEAQAEDAEGDTSICRITWALRVLHRSTANSITSP